MTTEHSETLNLALHEPKRNSLSVQITERRPQNIIQEGIS